MGASSGAKTPKEREDKILDRAHESKMDPDDPAAEVAVFGGGCYWGLQLAMERIPNVLRTEVGFMGGHVKGPSYEAVCTGRTGHYEVVRVVFDPTLLKYTDLLNVFWERHNPTQADGQGNDIGPQYRSVIFTYSAEQATDANHSKTEEEKRLGAPVATQILAADDFPFYPGPEYHQHYLAKGGQCSLKQHKAGIRCYG